jgi:hypothetical protein
MDLQHTISDFYSENPIPNPLNVTLTQKQVVDGHRIDDTLSEQNFRHFRNLLNRKVFGNAYTRHGRQLGLLVVRENSALQRHHLHAIIEIPERIPYPEFCDLMRSCWSDTRFGYHQVHFERPETKARVNGWQSYCLKKRSKDDFASSIDWVNSTCFERR